MKLNLAGTLQSAIRRDSWVDGVGIRITLFTCYCPHRCKGCQNPQTWKYENGTEYCVEEIVEYLIPLLNSDRSHGLTLSGGDPFGQPEAIRALLVGLRARMPYLNIWCYTGFDYEDVPQGAPLELIDVLVDGVYEEGNRYPLLPFRGSRNQRILYLREGIPYLIE